MKDEKPPIQLSGKLETTTAKAYYFQADNWTKFEWLPKSQCEWHEEVGNEGVMTISAWLAGKNGWSEV